MKKIRSLTSLRFFAAACIVLGHGGGRFHYSFDAFDLRYGVTFFFVLSGFILAYTYADFNWKTDLREFVGARIARLYPASLATTIAAIILFTPVANGTDLAHLLLNVFLLQAWIPISSWHYSFNAVTWSISTEMFFYGMFPLALTSLRKPIRFLAWLWIPAAVMVFIATSLNLSAVEGGPDATAWGIIYINPLSRVTEFLAGVLAYKCSERLGSESKNWSYAKAALIELGALLVLLGSMMLSTYAAQHLIKAIAPQLSIYVQVISAFPAIALFIVVMRQEKGIISQWLASRWLVYLGEVSFSLYLVHQLVIRWMFSRHAELINSYPVPAYAFYWGASLAIAMLIFHLIEKPLRMPLRRLLAGHLSVVGPVLR